MRTLILILFSSFLLFSCEKSLITNSPSKEDFKFQTIQPTIQNNAEAMPAQPGDNMKVFRGENYIGWFFNDADKGIQAFINVDIRAYCDYEPAFDLVDYQFIVTHWDEDSFRELVQFKGADVEVSVWEKLGFFDRPDDCLFYFENDPIFTSIGDFVYTDNDWSPDENLSNTYSWGMNFHGDGIIIVARFTYNPNTGVFKPNVKIKMK